MANGGKMTTGTQPRLLQTAGKSSSKVLSNVNKNTSAKPGNKSGMASAVKTNDSMVNNIKCSNCGGRIKPTAISSHMSTCGSGEQDASF